MIPVTFIQFIAPNGEREIVIDLPDELGPKLDAIEKAGCRLTAEAISTGVCSFCIEHPAGDVEIELHPNGPGVADAITKMINRFSLERVEEFKRQMEFVEQTYAEQSDTESL